MPLEAPLAPVPARVAALNARYLNQGAVAVLTRALSDPELGRIAMVSSFGAESVALLHLVSVIDRSLPVILLDTELLFDETLAYQVTLTGRLGLTDVRVIRPDPGEVFHEDNEGLLHLYDPDACCRLRKVRPLARALEGFDSWVTGRKRYQGGQRQTLDFFEAEDDLRIKINPLAHWESADVQDYIVNNRLPRHPLVARGYASIGCAPCTTPVNPSEDARAGRWRSTEKTECGIHFNNGRALRGPAAQGASRCA